MTFKSLCFLCVKTEWGGSYINMRPCLGVQDLCFPECSSSYLAHFNLKTSSIQSSSFSNPSAPSNLNESLSSGKGKPYNPQQVQGRIREILGKYSNGFWVSKLPQIYRELYKQDLPTEAIKDLDTWTHICTVCIPYVTLVICYNLIL